MNAYFPSRKGTLMWFVVVLLTVMAAVQFYFSLSSGIKAIFVTLAIWVPTFLLVLTLFLGTGYTIKDGELVIKIGPFVYSKIKIEAIKSATRSYNLIASPANSLRRLELKYEGGMVLISPEREEAFIRLIKELNPSVLVKL